MVGQDMVVSSVQVVVAFAPDMAASVARKEVVLLSVVLSLPVVPL